MKSLFLFLLVTSSFSVFSQDCEDQLTNIMNESRAAGNAEASAVRAKDEAHFADLEGSRKWKKHYLEEEARLKQESADHLQKASDLRHEYEDHCTQK